MTRERGADQPPVGVPWGAADVLLVVALVLVALVLTLQAAAGLAMLLDVGTRGELLTGLGVTIAAELLAALLILSYLTARYKLPIRQALAQLGFRDLQPAELLWPFAFVVLAYLIIGVYVLVVTALGVDVLEPEQQVPGDVFDYPSTTVLAGVAIVLVAPVAEELFFRGFVFAGLIRTLGVPGAAVAAGLLFGLAHFQPGLFVPFSLVGVLFGYIYHWTRSLWVTVASHLLFNAIGFAGMLAGVVLLS
ncbi:MAG TPA: CPBP family intramembrane glutamic endopeptidase [Dehalococcoidia bacterium]